MARRTFVQWNGLGGQFLRQIKVPFHGPEGKGNLEATIALTAEVRAPLACAIKEAFVPVTHAIRIVAE